MFKFIVYIIHTSCILFMCCLVSWECSIISYYQNTEIILTRETQRYNFTFAALIMNIFNALFLIWVLLDKHNTKLIKCLIFLLIFNFVIGLTCCILYNDLYYYGRFNDVIIIEFYLFITKCILFLIYQLYIIITYMLNRNNNIVKKEYTQVLIADIIN